jgi:hypothetical protein
MKSNSIVGAARPSAANLLSWCKECGALPRRRSAGRRLALLLTFILLHSSFCLRANAQRYSIDSYTFSGGASASAGGAFSVSGAPGQSAAAGAMTGGNYSVTGGLSSLFALQTAGAPALRIFLTTTNTVVLAWPATSVNWSLQFNTDLTTTNWATASNPAIVVGGENQLVIPPPAGNTYFRLSNP